MPVPLISVTLVPGVGHSSVDLTSILSQETGATLSDLIEDPTGTNNFTAGDVSFKGYDAPGGTTIQALFSGILPTSTDYTVTIALGINPPFFDAIFKGYVAPNTLQFEPRTGAFSFTVIGLARNLQTTSAANLFQRPGYPTFPATGFVAGYDSKWCLAAAVSTTDTSIQVQRVDGVIQVTPDFYAGDQIQILSSDKFTVTSVLIDSSTGIHTLGIGYTKPPSANFAPGGTQLVHLLTPYQRNLKLQDVVQTLFTAAGFPTKQYFGSAPLPNSSLLFADSVDPTGLPGGASYGVGISVAPETGGLDIALSNAGGAFITAGPLSGWTLITSGAGYTQPPVDPTNYGIAKTMFGAKRTITRSGNISSGITVTMKFYGYDHLNGSKRYVLTVTCTSTAMTGPPYTILTTLASETDSGGWVWGSNTPIGSIGINTTTSTNLTSFAFYEAIGIDVDPATGTVFFTDIQLTGGAGSPITMNTSSYQPVGAGYVANRATGVNGPIVISAPGRCVVFQLDGWLGAAPAAHTYTLSGPGVMTVVSTQPQSPYIVGATLRKNAGDQRYYALISDPVQGTQLASWASDSLVADSAHPPSLIAVGAYAHFQVDLTVQWGAPNPPGTADPMFALLGGRPVYISNTGSGFVTYADASGLSVADMLQQLTILNAGVFYLTAAGWDFRSRSSPMPVNDIGNGGASDQIDGDSGFLNLTAQPIYNLWTGYVSITNENDSTIFGDTGDVSGSIAYSSANTVSGQSSYSLELKSRFVSSSSFANALAHSLYNYLGAKKHWIQVDRLRDGRTYEVGRTFHRNVDGSNRQFQIIEVDLPIADVTVKVVGLEV